MRGEEGAVHLVVVGDAGELGVGLEEQGEEGGGERGGVRVGR